MGQPIIHPQKLLLLMPVNYSIAMRPNPQDPEQPKKAYAQAQTRDELTLKGLSRRISSQTTVSQDMVEALKAGDQVDFGELGKFRLQLTSEGAATAEEFTANNITGVNIHTGSSVRKLSHVSCPKKVKVAVHLRIRMN